MIRIYKVLISQINKASHEVDIGLKVIYKVGLITLALTPLGWKKPIELLSVRDL